MKIIKQVKYQCAAIVLPGEFVIDRWDGKQCEETNPYRLVKCELCGNSFCMVMHWHKHLDTCG